jgi:uncharacterized protein YjbI with pentapeptide repeats
MTNTLDLTKLEGVTLTQGHHNIQDQHEGCAMDAIAWAATGEITDMPACVHPILVRKVHQINDAAHTTEDDRWLIVREGGPLLVGSNEWGASRVLHVIARCGVTAAGFVAALFMQPGADLSGANLSRADLYRANLSRANLYRADLYRANLSRADLSGANLSRADLSGANPSRADLSGADLSGANLSGANLFWADPSGANLSRANLYRANLSGANLYRANLSGANADRYTVWPDGFDAAAAGVVFS